MKIVFRMVFSCIHVDCRWSMCKCSNIKHFKLKDGTGIQMKNKLLLDGNIPKLLTVKVCVSFKWSVGLTVVLTWLQWGKGLWDRGVPQTRSLPGTFTWVKLSWSSFNLVDFLLGMIKSHFRVRRFLDSCQHWKLTWKEFRWKDSFSLIILKEVERLLSL